MKAASIEIHDFAPAEENFRDAVLAGLKASQKEISAKYFYDERGSALFEKICELEEYYPTRTEIGAYIPVDISKEHLVRAAEDLARDYPNIDVTAVCADYTQAYTLPVPDDVAPDRKTVFFPGSTIGNFMPDQAVAFLGHTARLLTGGGELLIGVDLKKDEATLNAAYNDKLGVTAAFNLNLLTRINRELGANFDLDCFRHHAFYNAEQSQIEMHLISERVQTVTIDGEAIDFAKGETIHTENSHKYTVEEFHGLAGRAGFTPVRVWTDPDHLFSLHYLQAA
jgi:dimethylhistidine N-methyltransferase